MRATAKRLSAEEFFRLLPDGRSLELLNGEIVETPDGGGVHGYVGQRVNLPLARFVEEQALGEVPMPGTGFLLDPETVRKPDIAFVDRALWPDPPPEGFLPFAPTLAVEIVSPNDVTSEIEKKVREYIDAGTMEVWVVSPFSRTIQVWRARGKPRILTTDDTLETDLLPGFDLPIASIFG